MRSVQEERQHISGINSARQVVAHGLWRSADREANWEGECPDLHAGL